MMKGGFGNLMKQAQQMQENLEDVRASIAAIEVTGEAGGGLVKTVMTGQHDMKQITIDPSLLNEDKDMLEDLIVAAVNDANRRIEAVTQEKMSGMTADMGLPPGIKLPL